MNKQTVYIPTQGDWKQEGYTLVDSEGEYMSNLYKKEAYVFTPEELKQLLSDAFDAGKGIGIISYQPQGHTFDKELYYERKEEYIENLLNKEK